MKIIYMGTPDFAVAPLEAMLHAGYEVLAVVTQPDRQKGRGKEVSMSPVKECALKHGIPVLQPTKIREQENVEQLAAYGADIFVVAAFGQILSEELLTMPKYGCINIHASLLPAYRGAAPIQWSILNGEKETGVTIQQMAKGIDTGDILSRVIVKIGEKETGESLFTKLMTAGAELLTETLPKIESGRIVPEKQKEEEASYAGKLDKNMGEIDWNKSAKEIERWIRGLNSWPSAYTHYKGKTLKIWEADVLPTEEGDPQMPGEVVFVGKEFFDVMTGEGILRIRNVQLEGKKRMAVKDFLLGYSMQEQKLGL